MNSRTMAVLAVVASIGAMPAVTRAQGVRQSEAIAAADAMSQVSMYSYREGPRSDVFLRGTPLAATAEGKARVEYQDGNARISAEVENLPEPLSLGPYTTYVPWAPTPEGRATNQGVIGGHSGGKGELQTRYGASQFALIVTAEPHFAVTAPSTMIALSRLAIDDATNPVEVVRARYAIAIARAAGADRFASRPFEAAKQRLAAGETALNGKRTSDRCTAAGLAREATVAGEDVRRSAMMASAQSAAEAEERAAAVASEAANVASRAAAAEAAIAAALATELATEVERQRSAVAASNVLRERLNAALPTRDSNRGLISEIGGVQFATGRPGTNASGRESLAKLAGVVAPYPGLRFKVEGHTDSVGSVASNNELSLQRAISVRDYLIEQGVAASMIDVAGLGPSVPVGDNTTIDGRTRNRRVEIVISGGP